MEGGVLSHACSIAREMQIPSITGVGKNLNLKKYKSVKLFIVDDSGIGTIELY